MVRQSFACALLLLAARKAGVREASTDHCEEVVRSAVMTLLYWEQEAPDLKASRLILESIVEDL